MDTLKNLYSRKSVRTYTGEAVSEEAMQTVLKAACASPVGMAKYQTIHMTVITNKELLDELDKNAAAFFGDPSRTPLYGAPALIVVSSNESGNVSSANVAMIVHNMCIAANELGMGSVAIYGATAALATNPELMAKLNLPEGFVPTGSIAFGPTTEVLTEREISLDKIATDFIK